MGDDSSGTRAEYLFDVIPQKFAVAAQCVTLARGLIGEPKPGKIQYAHPMIDAEVGCDVLPVDAAGRKPVHHQQQRSLRVAELSMEDVQTVGVLKRFGRGPREVIARP